MALGDRELSLSNLGLAIGMYVSSSEDTRGVMTLRQGIFSSSLSGPTNPGEIKMSDFYGDPSGSSEGIYGADMNPPTRSASVIQNSIIPKVIRFQWENTGSYFYKIANRWQNYKKQRVGTFYWKFTGITANASTYMYYSGSDANPPYYGNTHQTASAVVNFKGPSSSTVYHAKIDGWFTDYYNVNWNSSANAEYSQSGYLKCSKDQSGGGGGS